MAAFDGWAVVELLGHRVRYGRASEVTMFGEAFCKIEIPSEPPAVEFYSGKALYGIRPASEEAIRAYHAPRKALTAAPPPDDDFEDVEDDASGQQDDEPEDEPEDEDDDPSCAFCAGSLGAEPTARVETGPDGDSEVWHKRCAEQHAEPNAEGWTT